MAPWWTMGRTVAGCHDENIGYSGTPSHSSSRITIYARIENESEVESFELVVLDTQPKQPYTYELDDCAPIRRVDPVGSHTHLIRPEAARARC